MTDLSAAVQAARARVLREAGVIIEFPNGTRINGDNPDLEAALDRYGLLVGLQRARESVERIGCVERDLCPRGLTCPSCRELRALDAEIEQVRRP